MRSLPRYRLREAFILKAGTSPQMSAVLDASQRLINTWLMLFVSVQPYLRNPCFFWGHILVVVLNLGWHHLCWYKADNI